MSSDNTPNSNGDTTHQNNFDEDISSEEKENELILSIMAYLGPFVIVPYAFSKQPTVVFHAKQGTVLIGCYLILMILATFINSLLGDIFNVLLFNSIHIMYILLAGFGIRNVLNKKQLVLPLIGKYHTVLSFNK